MSDRVQVQVTDRDGTPRALITDPIDCRFTDPTYDAVDGGEGGFSIPIDHALAAQVQEERIARIVVDGSELPVGFEIATIDFERVNEGEHAGMIMRVSGEAPGIVLGTSEVGGGVVAPCGGVDAFTGDTRTFGWVDCCCFDHAARFTGSLAMCHRQDQPVAPFTTLDPDGWPDGGARRVYCSNPTETTSGTNAVQTISFGTSINSGHFTLTFEGGTTAPITSPWSAADVKAALEALWNVDGVTVTGAGIDGDPYIITFDTGNVAGRPVELLGTDHSQLNHPPNQAVNPVMTVEGKRGVYTHSEGCCYVYDTFTLATDMSLVLFVNMSETGEVWIDGTRVFEQTTGSQGERMQTVSLDLKEGEHCITASACKTSDVDQMAWIMWSLAQAQQDDEGEWELTEVVHRSNCAMLAYHAGPTDEPPGANVGEMAICLIDESQALGDLAEVTTTFTKTHDSGGVPWADEFVWGVKIGTGLLDVVMALCELSGSTFRMSPDLELSIWQDRGTDRTATVVFSEGTQAGGMLDGMVSRLRKRASHLQIETQEGFATATDASSTGPQRRLGVTMGTSPTISSLADFAIYTFRDVGRQRRNAVIQTWGPTGKVPYTNFDVRDDITAPGPAGTGIPWKIVSIQMQMDSNGDPRWTLLLEDLP
jgi:hypothetical protein